MKCMICYEDQKYYYKICHCKDSLLCKNCYNLSNQYNIKNCPLCRRKLTKKKIINYLKLFTLSIIEIYILMYLFIVNILFPYFVVNIDNYSKLYKISLISIALFEPTLFYYTNNFLNLDSKLLAEKNLLIILIFVLILYLESLKTKVFFKSTMITTIYIKFLKIISYNFYTFLIDNYKKIINYNYKICTSSKIKYLEK